MIIFHTSTIAIPIPDIVHSREGLDFGKGFYCTALLEQAKAYGQRFSFKGMTPILNEYLLDDNYVQANTKRFEYYDEEWLDFIVANRKLLPVTSEYDIIEGGVADDKIFRTIDLFLTGDIPKSEALQRLKYEKPNHQICFKSQQAIDKYLRFITSYTI